MRRLFLGFALLVLSSSASLADGGSSREMTAGEEQYYRNTQQALSRAVPAGPTGWTKEATEGPGQSVSHRILGGEDRLPILVGVAYTWRDATKREATETEAMQAASQLLKSSEEVRAKAEQERLRAFEALRKPMEQAAAKGDMKELERINKEFDAINARYAKALENTDNRQKNIEEERIEKSKNTTLILKIRANPRETSLERPKKVAMGPRGSIAYRSDNSGKDNYGWNEASTFVFLGRWKLINGDQEYPSMTPATDPKLPNTRTQSILVEVRASDKQAAEMIARIDWEVLNKLLP